MDSAKLLYDMVIWYKGSYTSAHVLLNLLNELGKKMRDFAELLIGFLQRV